MPSLVGSEMCIRDRSTTVLQVCIALAAIALLTKKKWLEYAMFGAGGLGIIVGALAALHL